MKFAALILMLASLSACDRSNAEISRAEADRQALGGNSIRYEAFEVPEFGLVCVGSIRGISCLKK